MLFLQWIYLPYRIEKKNQDSFQIKEFRIMDEVPYPVTDIFVKDKSYHLIMKDYKNEVKVFVTDKIDGLL